MTTLHECLRTIIADIEDVPLDTEAEILLYNFVSFISTRGVKENKTFEDQHSQNGDEVTESPKSSKPKKSPKEKKEKKEKKERDPDAPKRPAPAWLLYSQEVRPQLKQQFPDLSFGEFSQKIGECWNNLQAEEKKKYTIKAEKAKADYKVALEQYKLNKNL